MKSIHFLAAAAALAMVACAPASPVAESTSEAHDGLTLSSSTGARLTGTYDNGKGLVLQFDSSRVQDDLYFDLKAGTVGKPLLHIETQGDTYQFTYLDGRLTMHTTKAFVAAAKAQPDGQPNGVSTDGFIWEGDRGVLDEMLQVPEVAALPFLSRALGARGFTGNQFPATMAVHKIARQSAEGLGIQVPQLDATQSVGSYCQAYPNSGNQCYGMCGNGCNCWSWVCGDCCYHSGCATHDDWCRSGQWYYCYNITAVIALFGC
jgi:hypothetical protein